MKATRARETATDKDSQRATATIAAVVPAAGCGARAALNGNKVLAPLRGRPLLAWTLLALASAQPGLENLGLNLTQIVIAARREEFAELAPLAEDSSLAPGCSPFVTIVEGGTTRQESVGNAARATTADFVLVHDAARPLLLPELVVRVAQAALQFGGAIAALPASDTVKIASENSGTSFVANTLDRQAVWLAQTPQIFRRELYLQSLERAEQEQFAATDCASLLEHAGHRVALVEGEAENIKVTFREDLARAETILRERSDALN